MENYKVKAGSEAKSKEAQELFVALGGEVRLDDRVGIVCLTEGKIYTDDIKFYDDYGDCKELTIPQLRDMVVLKRNDVGDATHTDQDNWKWFIGSDGIGYVWECGNADNLKQWDQSSLGMVDLKPITKEPIMKEYLDPENDYKFIVTDKPFFDWIEVPEGSMFATGSDVVFRKNNYIFVDGQWKRTNVTVDNAKTLGLNIVWQRETQSEALPFIDDEPKYDPEDIKIAKGYDLDELAKEYKLRDRYDGETDEYYRYALEHYIDLENYIAKETLNDKVASAEVARKEFIGAPFSDLPEVNFEAVDDVDAEFFPDEKHAHYKKDISHLDILDIYRVTELFNPHSCGAHIAKKALCSGQRGHKDLLTDIQDIIDTAERWKEMLIEDEKAK